MYYKKQMAIFFNKHKIDVLNFTESEVNLKKKNNILRIILVGNTFCIQEYLVMFTLNEQTVSSFPSLRLINFPKYVFYFTLPIPRMYISRCNCKIPVWNHLAKTVKSDTCHFSIANVSKFQAESSSIYLTVAM